MADAIAEPRADLRVYEHHLICWSSVIGGTLVAVAAGFTLMLLGVAIGATAISPFAPASEQAPGWTIGGGLWVAFSNLVAVQLGAFTAAHSARWPDHHDGALQGIMVWALSLVVAIGVLGFGVGGILEHASTSMHGLAQAATDTAQTATGQTSGAPNPLSPDEAEAAKKAALVTAWWAFATVVLGGVGAVAGGKLGSAHPKWEERRVRPVTLADRV
ncbi:MAG: hypothetical protein GC155_11760 [Alphaproteobacteria bacterium]|nr:hypothetical protein [Alphaproteobacteria bacterium]